MSGLYGATAIKKVNLEGDRVSFKIDLEFGERKFEMSFEGKVEDNKLSGEMTTSRGIQKVKGTKVIRRFRRHREQQRERTSKHKDEGEHENNGGNEQLSLEQVPEPVKATILKQSQGGKIEEIELENENGKTIYEAEIIIDGKEYELKISPDGKLLSKELDDDAHDDD